MTNPGQLESIHGGLMRINGYGVLIIGPAGIGKSSLALELISQGQQLIADDVVELSQQKNTIIGHCPPMLEGLLHTRELGLISIPSLFGQDAWHQQQPIDLVVSLHTKAKLDSALSLKKQTYILLDHALPLLTLSTDNPASLVHRIECYLKMHANNHQADSELKHRQQAIMMTTEHREF